MTKIHRRDILKLIASLPLLWIAEPSAKTQLSPIANDNTTSPNILILVFDTLNAQHTSIDGYPRNTTPNLELFAEKATVYHRHYSTGGFTNPGTASLLTGTYPWTHRAFRYRSFVHKNWRNRNVFNLLGDAYHRIAYTHNTVAAAFLYQFITDLENLIPTRDFCLQSWQIADKLFPKDYQVAIWRERLVHGGGSEDIHPTSPERYRLTEKKWENKRDSLFAQYQTEFPRGLPNLHGDIFRMEEVIDWLITHLGGLPQPYISYFHFLPPHDPYFPRSDFIGKFDDGWAKAIKPEHHFTHWVWQDELNLKAKEYDEFIAYADAEFGRLYQHLSDSGILDNTMVIITSDHGEMFERGIWGHSTETLYDCVVRVPLLISRPGQKQRVDIHTPTSSVDVLPTILHQTGHTIPSWCEGEILPGFSENVPTTNRRVFTLDAKGNSVNKAITRGTLSLVKDAYKFIRYFGYPGYHNQYELYNMLKDPDELENVYEALPLIAEEILVELNGKLGEVNSPYLQG